MGNSHMDTGPIHSTGLSGAGAKWLSQRFRNSGPQVSSSSTVGRILTPASIPLCTNDLCNLSFDRRRHHQAWASVLVCHEPLAAAKPFIRRNCLERSGCGDLMRRNLNYARSITSGSLRTMPSSVSASGAATYGTKTTLWSAIIEKMP